jgi:PAS domain S-box-containing protein
MLSNHAEGGHDQTETLRERLRETEELLRAIRHGEIDALVVEGPGGNQVYTLHSAEAPYRDLVEQMQEGAVVVSGRGDILYSNARFAALVGEPLESVVGSRIDRFVNASDRDDFETLLGAGSGRRRSCFIGSDGGVIEVSLSLTTTTASTGGERLNLIVTDLRELLEATSHRHRAERDSRTKDEFLAMVAHELRNPLGAISNAVRVLELTHAEGAPAARAHDVIGRHVGHISRLIDDLLDVKRVISGKIGLHRKPIDLADAVHRAVATFTGDAGPDQCIEITTEPVWVDGDAVRIEQVLTNILTNAVKYTPPGGRIRVALGADGADAVLSVQDTGFGISPSLLPFIFDLPIQGIDARRSRRSRHRPRPRPAHRRGARRHHRGIERRRRVREPVHRSAEADSLGTHVRGSCILPRTSCEAQTRSADRRQRGGTRNVADNARARRARRIRRG